MIKFHAIVINICVIKKFSLCDKTTLPKLFTVLNCRICQYFNISNSWGNPNNIVNHKESGYSGHLVIVFIENKTNF